MNAASTVKISAANKNVSSKATAKEGMSPTAPPTVEDERTELLGSLTTQQQQRTSARVIKKLMLEPQEKRGKRPDGADDIPDCETPNKPLEDKEPLKFPTVKQRMPKALWSADEKSLFFEALNDYGKDFDAITAYIRGKMKKKGMLDGNLKTKTQVSHFYYRTWHKLSKHVHFGENVKKVAQELYALINYGELRRKLVSVNEKTCARLGELVLNGSIVVRARGRNQRVRTPMCRALRRLNQIAELALGPRLGLRALVSLRARTASAWRRVQAAAHNPRAAAALALSLSLRVFLQALGKRWRSPYLKKERSTSETEPKFEDNQIREGEETGQSGRSMEDLHDCQDDGDRDNLEDHLNMETDRTIVQESKLPLRPVLHVGPRPTAAIHLPVVSPSEQLSSQKICLASYLERMRDKNGGGAKIRATKRQRKDSGVDKDVEMKKFKPEDSEAMKLVIIEETAIDGIELMASYKSHHDDDDKIAVAYTTEDEKDIKSEETAEEEVVDLQERDKDMSEREKDSFSELEDDEKYTKSDSDNESDHGKSDKTEKDRKFKNLKVKFRIRSKKLGSEYRLVSDKEGDDLRAEHARDDDEHKHDEHKHDEHKHDEHKHAASEDVDVAVAQIRRGWSVHDAGELTIGDLYLMFGSRSKIELDYWWAEPTPPLPPLQRTQKQTETEKSPPLTCDKDKPIDKKEKMDKTPDKGTDSSVEDEKINENELMSPKNTFSQDSNDGLSGDERKSSQLASPEHKSCAASDATLKLLAKLVNRPAPPAPAAAAADSGFALMTDRLKRLLALASNAHVPPPLPAAAAPAPPPVLAPLGTGAVVGRCDCGHVCALKKQQKPLGAPCPLPAAAGTMFRHPTPIAPRPALEGAGAAGAAGSAGGAALLAGVPRRRRGRPRRADRRVVVQRLLPLLPKLPPRNNLIPVKIMPNSPPAPPKILPKPHPTSTTNTSDVSLVYVLSECNGQFYFHDGDRRIPISPLAEHSADELDAQEEEEEDMKEYKVDISETEVSCVKRTDQVDEVDPAVHGSIPTDASGGGPTAEFLSSESLSLSPSRLLREAWLEGGGDCGGDFSLSSFLGHLEGRAQPDLAVDSQLRSLMAESSVDYVAKFADLAAEVTEESNAAQRHN